MARAETAQRLPKEKVIGAIVNAMSNADLKEHEAWKDLDGLSSDTTVGGVYVDPAGIIVTGDRFVGLAAIYVDLKYVSDGDGDLETSDTLEGRFEGHFEGRRPIIDKITVDTTPFYA